MNIKKLWIAEYEGLYTLCIRQEPNTLSFFARQELMPPTEKIDGKRLSLKEANEQMVSELHSRIGLFTKEELIRLRDAINGVLNE